MIRLPGIMLAVTSLAGSLLAQDAVTPGTLSSPYPTIINLAVVWEISGDENLNAAATVRYRRAESGSWREGMPLRRVPFGRSEGTSPIFSWSDKLSGSIFDLAGDTEYEIEVTLSDPDGGGATRTLTARTRAVPRAPGDSVVKTADPSNYADIAGEARPGDVILLAPGDYGYGFAYSDGEPGRPLTIRAASRHPDSAAVFGSMSLRGREHVIVDGLTVNGKVDMVTAENCAVVRCSVTAVFGIVADQPPGAINCYIADNVVSWTNTWEANNMGASGDNEGEGIQLTGPGNVICYNRVSGYRDCISTLEDNQVSEQYCIDIYNNDIYLGLDDGIEADFCMGNCRIMRNRLTNCFMALSSQPSLGGPTYFIRNVMYNIIDNPFKLSRHSQGDVILHNTVVKVGDGLRIIHDPVFAYLRNNLAIGGRGGGDFGNYSSGEGRAMDFYRADSTTSIDYEGIGTEGTPFLAKLGDIKTYSIEELRAKTQMKHAVLVSMDVFANSPEFPDPALTVREPADLRLRPGSAAVDAGVLIPGINDTHTGSGPDLGALEWGAQTPHYGPRPPAATDNSGCDWDGDGRPGVGDVLRMLLSARLDPTREELDRDGDGSFGPGDLLLLLEDIAGGGCPESYPGL
ncbi:MAG: right-handed parallel beta-helix repeat-containing protein [Candidatus Glassbacteria bacterium]|nr:right-handed parallel beta-helix repeat-containing protein [Candidatus Glassbacteria bacterium]